MKKRIVCFGDSNTYGYDPRSVLGGRYPAEVRWTGRLDADLRWEILNCGENGREIPHTQPQFQALDRLLTRCGPVDGLVVMLGTNDRFQMYRPTAEAVAARMEELLRRTLCHPALEGAGVLLVAPPAVEAGAFSRRLSDAYRALADRRHISFADAAAWPLEMEFDGVHLSAAGHRVFAERMRDILEKWGQPVDHRAPGM